MTILLINVVFCFRKLENIVIFLTTRGVEGMHEASNYEALSPHLKL